MAPITMGLGGFLIALGVGFFLGTDAKTALIPVGFGVVFLVLGFLARGEGMRKHAMHAAAAVGLIGFLGGAVMGILGLVKVLNDSPTARPLAALESGILAVSCALFVLLCVRSFIEARRRRQQGAGT